MFELGQVVATPAALEALRNAGQTPAEFVRRHVGGDWGDVDEFDGKQNAMALQEGGRRC